MIKKGFPAVAAIGEQITAPTFDHGKRVARGMVSPE
jgi:hypothetical protein